MAFWRTASRLAMSTSTTGAAGSAQPEWLQRILRQKQPGPKLYKWTVDDVVGNARDGSRKVDKETLPSDDADSRRIYVLGLGNLGRLIAVGLAQLPERPPVTLVVHRKSLLEHWHQKPGVILHRQGYVGGRAEAEDSETQADKVVDFDVEMWSEEPPPSRTAGTAQEIGAVTSATSTTSPTTAPSIANLIVTTKAQDALAQVDWLRRYLCGDSTVVFAQNGINKLWPPYGDIYNAARYSASPSTRGTALKHPRQPRQHPNWLAAVVTHGVTSVGPFESVHASPAGITLGVIGKKDSKSENSENNENDKNNASYLTQQLLRSPLLHVRQVETAELLMAQLEKLAVNAVYNPLTAVLRCKNGDLFSGEPGDKVARIADQLLAETSNVMLAHVLQDPSTHELLVSSSSPVEDRLSLQSLRALVDRVGSMVKDNYSSMYQDAVAGKPTEIGEFNGWVVETAAYRNSVNGNSRSGSRDAPLVLDVTTHKKLIQLVEGGVVLTRDQLGEYFGL